MDSAFPLMHKLNRYFNTRQYDKAEQLLNENNTNQRFFSMAIVAWELHQVRRQRWINDTNFRIYPKLEAQHEPQPVN